MCPLYSVTFFFSSQSKFTPNSAASACLFIRDKLESNEGIFMWFSPIERFMRKV